MKPNLISGIQPSGRLHIGNWLGALKNFVDLQKSDAYQCSFFIADLHSLTESANPSIDSGQAHLLKKQQTLDILASFIAAGIDPKQSMIFVQSHVPAHSELAWILNTITPFGELSRMTQFKDKSERHNDNINVGLFTYPVLQAADIILYDAQFVPVGEDQIQHLELARTLARKFNNKFGATFIEPQALLTAAPRIMSLTDPARKMSKSEPEGCLFLDDEPETVEAKIMSAVTDSGSGIIFDPANKPGIANLLAIYSNITGEPVAELEKKFAGKNYAQFKKSLAKALVKYFTPFRRKKMKLLAHPEKLVKIAARGGKAANKIANEKIKIVKQRLGLS